MPKFLLDANLSFETRDYLVSLGYKAYTAAQFNLSQADDLEIIELARKKNLVLITLDMDFGQIYFFSSKFPSGIIILKLTDQTIESVNKTLDRLLAVKILEKKKFQQSLVIVDEKRIRIRTKN